MIGKRDNWPGICASVGLHALAAVILLLSLSGKPAVTRQVDPLDLVWVSLAAKDTSVKKMVVQTPRKPQQAVKPVVQAKAGSTEVPAEEKKEAVLPAASIEPASARMPILGGGAAIADAPVQGRISALSDGHAAGHGMVAAVPVFADARPLYKENPPPAYPAIARHRGYHGVVHLQAEILTDGSVGKIRVSRSSGYDILDHTAVEAVRAWKFEPARKSGIPCKTWAELPIKFVISNDHS